MKIRLLIILFLLAASRPYAQEINFGLQYRPLIPNRYFDNEATSFTPNYQMEVSGDLGHSFGAVIRIGITERFAIETAINQIRRNHTLRIHSVDSNYYDTTSFGMIAYEIPIQGLYFVQLSRYWFMNALAGVSFNMFPTDVESQGQTGEVFHISYRREWVQMSLLANIGFEYRSENSGTFYIGASLHRPFNRIFDSYVYEMPNFIDRGNVPITGNFLSLDLKYFFPIAEDED